MLNQPKSLQQGPSSANRRTQTALTIHHNKGQTVFHQVKAFSATLQQKEIFSLHQQLIDSDSDSEYFINPQGEIVFVPDAPCKLKIEI